MKKDEDDILSKIKKICVIIFIISTLFILLSLSIYTINAGYRGVLLTFGKPSMDAKLEGIHFKIPIVQTIQKMEVRTQKYQSDLAAASKDLQDVKTTIAINYHLLPERVPEIYRDVGINYGERLIQPLESEVNKQTTALFDAQDLIQKREEVRGKMLETLKEKLEPRGIVVEEVSIINFEFSKSFTESIEMKVVALQLKLKAENDLQRIRVEAEQKVTSATAEAKALELQKQQITSDLIRLRQVEVQKMMIDKWDGKLPIVMGSSNPFIDLTSIMNKS